MRATHPLAPAATAARIEIKLAAQVEADAVSTRAQPRGRGRRFPGPSAVGFPEAHEAEAHGGQRGPGPRACRRRGRCGARGAGGGGRAGRGLRRLGRRRGLGGNRTRSASGAVAGEQLVEALTGAELRFDLRAVPHGSAGARAALRAARCHLGRPPGPAAAGPPPAAGPPAGSRRPAPEEVGSSP
jgi:hypothetical protein